MPVNKDAMARYRIIDRMLADPHKDYTTKDIEKAVAHECPKVTTRMIQKDIKALEEAPFNKKVLRGKGGRGTVRYEDQSNPLFYQELTADEEDILREALGSLGQFEGLDNFKWLENLKKRLDMTTEKKERPVISFARNNVLQISENILGHLYSAISRKKVIRFQIPLFSESTRSEWLLLFDDVLASALEAGPLRSYRAEVSVEDAAFLQNHLPGKMPLSEAIELIAYYKINKLEGIDWTLFPSTSFEAFFGNTNFTHKWQKVFFDFFGKKTQECYGVARYMIHDSIAEMVQIAEIADKAE